MRRAMSVIGVVIACGAMLVYSAGAADAVAPSNDTAASATVVSTLPFSDTLDTTQATTDATDAALNSSCGAPATEASVWYSYTPAADGTIVIDVSQSTYSAGIITASGTPGSLSLLSCGPRTVVQDVTAGQPVYIMAFDDTPGSGNGGTLQISVTNAPPPPVESVTINRVGRFNSRTGAATITGTVTCTGADVIDLQTSLRQNVGRVAITGTGFVEVPCNGTNQWSMVITGDNGRFGGGKASADTSAFACGIVSCSNSDTTAVISLKK